MLQYRHLLLAYTQPVKFPTGIIFIGKQKTGSSCGNVILLSCPDRHGPGL